MRWARSLVPFSQVRSTFPVLKNPANHHKPVGFDLDQWSDAFTNGFTEEQSRALIADRALAWAEAHARGGSPA
jgi:hypothetical protein